MIGAALMTLAVAITAPPSFEEFFEDFQARRQGIEVLQAFFLEENYLPGEVFASEGTVLYARPRRLVRRTESPDKTTLLVDGGQAYQYEPEVEQCVIYDLEDEPAADILFLGFDSDLAALNDAYEMSIFSVVDEAAAAIGKLGVIIRPYAEDLETAPFQEVSLYLRDADYLPWKIRVVTDAETQTIIMLKDYRINGNPDPSETQIILPEGTTLVENDKIVETVSAQGRRIPNALYFTAPPVPTAAPAEDLQDEAVSEDAPLEVVAE